MRKCPANSDTFTFSYYVIFVIYIGLSNINLILDNTIRIYSKVAK